MENDGKRNTKNEHGSSTIEPNNSNIENTDRLYNEYYGKAI